VPDQVEKPKFFGGTVREGGHAASAKCHAKLAKSCAKSVSYLGGHFPFVCITNCTKQKVTTGYQHQGCNPLYLSAIAAGVELSALLQLIHECCQAFK